MKNLPRARSREILVQELEKEFLVYDLEHHKAFHLNDTSALVYKFCDGETSFDELKRKHKLSDDVIYLALDELYKNDLLDADKDYASPFAGINRREVIRRVGFASVIALPIVSSIVAPAAADAQSACIKNVCINGAATPGNDCGGCTGPVTFDLYNSTNGTCTNFFTSFNANCSNDNIQVNGDFIRR